MQFFRAATCKFILLIFPLHWYGKYIYHDMSFFTSNIWHLYIQHFYHVLTCMRRPQGKGLELAKKHIVSCLSELDSMLKSGEFLRSNNACGTLEDGIEDKTTASGCQPIGFDSTLNSRSAAPTPPRAIKLFSWKKVSWRTFQLKTLLFIFEMKLMPFFFIRQSIISRSFFMI